MSDFQFEEMEIGDELGFTSGPGRPIYRITGLDKKRKLLNMKIIDDGLSYDDMDIDDFDFHLFKKVITDWQEELK